MTRYLGAMLGAFILSGCSGEPEADNGADGGERRTPVAAYEVAPRDLSRQVTLSASVQPRVNIQLNSRTQGTVLEVLMEEGDAVSQGDLLARFDVQEDVVELRRAQARETEAELEFERIERLRETDSVSVAELQRAQATYDVAQAERELWQTRVNFGSIRAPQDAVVTQRYIEPGEAVESQEPLFELGVMSELVLRPGVSERDVRHLTIGQQVPVYLDAMPNEPIAGQIRRIFPMADRSSRLVQVEIILPPDSFERGVRPGFLGRMPMIIDARPETIAVPAAAIGESGDERYLYVIEDDRLQRRTVETGITRGQWIQILEGLAAGEIILATNPIDMSDGTAVRIVGFRG